MKNFGTTLSMAIVLTAGLLTFSACKKDKETSSSTTAATNNEQTTAVENNFAENMVTDIDIMGSQAIDNGNLSTFKTDGSSAINGATVTGYGTNIITVDFGTTGTYGSDGRTRTGKLIYTISSSTSVGSVHYRNPGFSMSVGSQNYVVDSTHVTIIDKTVSNTTPANIPATGTPSVNLTWAITASLSITKANGSTYTWGCSRNKELTNTNDPTCYQGQQTPIVWSNAVIRLNGSSSGTNTLNETFTAVIVNLVKKFQCSPTAHASYHPFISGTIVYTPGTRPTRTIDFGSGVCDNIATITINNLTLSLTLL